VHAWLAVRMRSRSLDRRKSAAARRNVSNDEAIATQPTAHPESEPGRQGLEHRKLARAVAALSAEQAEALMLGYFEDLSCSEIAERLGIPIGTVKSRVRRALSILREDLADGTRGAS
jgi:RNA polymerase sigma-70 factor (ECF subfamily)